MKILLVGFKLSIGNELYMNMLYKYLKENNIEIDICGDSNYIKKYNIGKVIANGGNAKQMFIDTINPINWIKFYKLLKKGNYDYVFFVTSHTLNNIAIILVKLFKNIKIISQIHDPLPHSGTSYAKIIFYSQKIQSILSDLVIVAGKSLKNDIIKYYNKEANKIFVLPLGSHRKEKSFINKSKRQYFSVLGRIEEYKGIDVFLKAIIKILKDENMKKLKFVIAGDGDISKYKNLIQQIPKENLVIKNYLISDEEFDEIIKNSYAVVLPYKDGTQTGTVQIAYSNSTPCIVTKVGSIYELVEDKKTGYIIEPNNVEELVNAIKKMFFNSDIIEMEKNAYAFYNKYLKWDSIINQLIEKLNRRDF
ncbi:glycosyltransferase family 4 protein [Hippea sp. KM1]|uniref:glycosyltransferase family 4 protein n=1 Tax=Hippea sp. KM1 TaxID=944481 RepID=UPI00046CF858|nr:glycosyltransferase family 4 protein [Hippea sp. KM1]